jgi:hypothetical protein
MAGHVARNEQANGNNRTDNHLPKEGSQKKKKIAGETAELNVKKRGKTLI